MSITQLRGLQLKIASVGRDRIDAPFEASLAQIESNIVSIFNTMSTDAERMAAVEALTLAFESADGTLQGAITALVNAAKVGAGLEADGSLVLGLTNYLGSSASLKAATLALDAALKLEADARIAAITDLQTSLTEMADNNSADAAAALAAAVAAQAVTDAAQDAALAAEVTRSTNSEGDLQVQITNEVDARTLLNETLSTAIAQSSAAATAANSQEATTRAAAVNQLQSNLDSEALARTTADGVHTAAISQEVADRTQAVSDEATARAAADAALSGRVDVLETAVPSIITYDKIVTRETPVGVINDVNAVFTLANTPYAGTETVFLNGVMLEPGEGNDYQLDGKVITLASAPLTGDRVKVSYFR